MHHLRVVLRGSRFVAAMAALVTATLASLIVVDDQPAIHAALIGLAVAAVVTLAVVDGSAVLRGRVPTPQPPAEERRRRGGFRRQHRPDTPGRPLPRAPGSTA